MNTTPAVGGRLKTRGFVEDVTGSAIRRRRAGRGAWREVWHAVARGLCRPSPRVVVSAVAVLAADQAVYQLVGSSVALQAPLDETAHLLTTLLILWALARPFGGRVLVPALIASVVIDVDHIPHQIGIDWLTAGTARPYSHSLLTIVVVLVAATASRRRAVALAVAVGVASHLWRDLAEPVGAGVALLWPFSDRTYELPAAVYLGGMGALVIIALARAVRRGRAR